MIYLISSILATYAPQHHRNVMKRILLFWKVDQIIRETIFHKKFIRMQTYTEPSSLAVTSVEVKIKAAKGVTDSN